MSRYVVSACLAGEACRYDGGHNGVAAVKALVEKGLAVTVCPECLGGLETPRSPSEIKLVNGKRKVYNRKNEDLTAAFEAGAAAALRVAEAFGAEKAILKAKSPSCGCGEIYDGSFSGRRIPGDGLAAALFKSKGLEVITEKDPQLTIDLKEESMENKIKLGVVFGGQSGEHEVSRVSATNVLEVINQDKYAITVIGITKTGEWDIYTGPYAKIADGSWEEDAENRRQNIDVFNELGTIDVFFPVMHGPMGEDGTIQGVFEMLNKPYVGNGVLAAAVGMDKVFSKVMFVDAGIPTGPYMYFRERRWGLDQAGVVAEIESDLGYPVFIKPVNMGSSVGISKAHNQEELISGILLALKYDKKILVEANIEGHEIECAVLEDGGEIKASIPGEIVASAEFYDYDAKYNSGDASKVIIPAPLDAAILDQVRDYAVKAFEAIECSGLSRVDFFVRKSDHQILINEVNTLPGFTNISMYPKMWEASGIPYADLVEKIIQSADRKRVTDY